MRAISPRMSAANPQVQWPTASLPQPWLPHMHTSLRPRLCSVALRGACGSMSDAGALCCARAGAANNSIMSIATVVVAASTGIFATTRSVPASVKVTPFSSANGIFIDWIFSSGVIRPPAFP